VRVSVVDVSNMRAPRYRHVLLVEPVEAASGASFEAVHVSDGGPLHAGGMVWFGDKLYVADTGNGFRVFDLGRIIEVTHTDDTDRVGVSSGRMDAHGYRYIVPQVARYRRAPGGCALTFSFVGLDRSESPPLLVTGEYKADATTGRLARWAVDPDAGWLIEEPDGVVYAHDAVVSGQTKMQGGVTWRGDWYISSSSQYQSFGRLYRTRPGRAESSVSAWVYGCEDLYLERGADRIWTAAEHPGARDVVSIPRLAP
jgi:hypothetical protein